MANRHSLHQQIRYLKHCTNQLGQSKHKTTDHTGKIFSRGTLEKYPAVWHKFTAYAKEQFHCRNISDFRSAHVYLYITDMLDAGKSAWTIKFHISALSKLNQVAQQEFHTKDFIQDVLRYIELPKRRLELRRPSRAGTYTQGQILAMAEALEQGYGQEFKWAVLFQWMTGARMESIVDAREKAINKSRLQETSVTLIEKGGKMRLVTISPDLSDLWNELRAWALKKENKHRFFALDRSRYSHAVAAVARRIAGSSCGTHGIRKAFAVARYKEYYAQSLLQDEKEKDKEARARVALDLGHGNRKTKGRNRIAVTYAYISKR